MSHLHVAVTLHPNILVFFFLFINPLTETTMLQFWHRGRDVFEQQFLNRLQGKIQAYKPVCKSSVQWLTSFSIRTAYVFISSRNQTAWNKDLISAHFLRQFPRVNSDVMKKGQNCPCEENSFSTDYQLETLLFFPEHYLPPPNLVRLSQ